MLIEETMTQLDLNLNQPVEEFKMDLDKISAWTVLKTYGFDCPTSKLKQAILKDKRERLKWAKHDKPEVEQYQIVFSDESKG